VFAAIVCATAVLVSVTAAASTSKPASTSNPLRVVALAPPSALREPGLVSEPHLALDPSRPSVLVAVAQTPSAVVAWRSRDGGGSWSPSRPLAGKSGRGGYGAGDPIVAVGRDGLVLLGGGAFDAKGRCTLLNRVGSYRSVDGGRTFGAFSVAGDTFGLPRHFFGTPPRPSCPLPKGLTHISINDKPWIAVDGTGGPRSGSAYLVWTRYDQFLDGRTFSTLLFARSRDGGKTYGRPIVVARRAPRPEALEQYSQVEVRPDGTIDVVWNDLRRGAVVILHAASKDGGASFGPPERITTIPSGRTPVGLVSSLAVSPSGTLAVCWSGSIRAKRFVPRTACSLSSGGAWSTPAAPFSNLSSQYLPAATFQGERLWVAAYQSTAKMTHVLLTRSDDGRTFAKPLVLAQRAFGRARICAPHPPDCRAHQSFVGDYIGAIANPNHVWVDFVLPVAGATSPNRVYVATLTTN
jgi:hypothetical protein